MLVLTMLLFQYYQIVVLVWIILLIVLLVVLLIVLLVNWLILWAFWTIILHCLSISPNKLGNLIGHQKSSRFDTSGSLRVLFVSEISPKIRIFAHSVAFFCKFCACLQHKNSKSETPSKIRSFWHHWIPGSSFWSDVCLVFDQCCSAGCLTEPNFGQFWLTKIVSSPEKSTSPIFLIFFDPA